VLRRVVMEYKRVVDLSVALGGPGVALLPDAPQMGREAVHTHDRHGRSNTRVSFFVHSGTHVDCPHHFYADGSTVDEVPLDRYMGHGIRLDLRDIAKERTPIAVKHVLDALPSGAPVRDAILVFNTGWMATAAGKPNFYSDNPYLGLETAEWLVENRVKAIAMDTSVDAAPSTPPRPGDSPIHRTLLGGGVMIIENLVNLDQLPHLGFTLMALPVKIYRGDGAPARAVAFIE
jgi:kynurenine formamidase